MWSVMIWILPQDSRYSRPKNQLVSTREAALNSVLPRMYALTSLIYIFWFFFPDFSMFVALDVLLSIVTENLALVNPKWKRSLRSVILDQNCSTKHWFGWDDHRHILVVVRATLLLVMGGQRLSAKDIQLTPSRIMWMKIFLQSSWTAILWT